MSAEPPLGNPELLVSVEPLAQAVPQAAVPARLFLRRSWQFLAITGLAVASYLLISHFLLQSVRVTGISMAPTLQDAQLYLLNRWVYYLRAPHLAEIVVLRDPVDNGFSVKRVVAGPGDSIHLRDGEVYVNGRRLPEPNLAPGTPTFGPPSVREPIFTCAAGQFFVLGDNRNSSIDSRTYGPVPRRNILGLIIR
jgi:signal peptidase I